MLYIVSEPSQCMSECPVRAKLKAYVDFCILQVICQRKAQSSLLSVWDASFLERQTLHTAMVQENL